MLAKIGERVRLRIGNLSSMSHHPMHIHGHVFNATETDGGPIPEAGQWPEITVLVPVGSTRTVEFIANNPGDWAFHCHMLHHVMNQMGHGLPNIIGINPENLDKKVRTFLPGYMTMGQDGMGDMGEMGMQMPRNSVAMVGAPGPHDYITMGGLFTNLKVREDLGGLKPGKERISFSGVGMRILLAPRRCLPVPMSLSAISARYPTPNPWTSRCTTWDTGEVKRDHSPQARCGRQGRNYGNERSYCKKWLTLGNGCVARSDRQYYMLRIGGERKRRRGYQ